jgi:hypothetical protein
MDLSFLDDILPSKPTSEIVQPANEPQEVKELPEITPSEEPLCACGHPADAHSDGDCEILECECTSYCPPSHDYNINSPAPTQDVQQGAAPVLIPEPTISDPSFTVEEESEAEGVVEVPSTTPNALTDLPAPSEEGMPDGFCQHLCECGKWWTHGDSSKCRYPDVVKQGKCQICLNGATYQLNLSADLKDGKLTPEAQINVRNDERKLCKNMNVQQLTFHIEFYAHKIEELRIRSLESRKLRSELEEEELQNIPEEEREAFIQALRRGDKEPKKRGTRRSNGEAKPKRQSVKDREAAIVVDLMKQGKNNTEAKLIATWMLKTGKTQAQVEAFLND